MSRSVIAALEPVPFARLPQLALPPRVRALVEGVFQTLLPVVDHGLERALDELERDLSAHVERIRTGEQRDLAVAGLRELRRHRDGFVHSTRCAIQRSLLGMVHAGTAAALAAEEVCDSVSPEEQLMLSQVAARAEIRAGQAMQELCWRLAVIAGRPPLEVEAVPTGPQQLCVALAVGARRFTLDRTHRMGLFRRIDKTLFAEARALYQALNRYLVAHRVYPNLRIGGRPEPATTSASEPIVDMAQVLAPSVPGTVPVPLPARPVIPEPDPQPMATASTQPPSAAELPLDVPVAGPAHAVPAAAWSGPARAPVDRPLDLEFFRMLRELAGGRRRAAAGNGDEARSRPLADRSELVQALGALQRQPVAARMLGVRLDGAYIRQELLNQMRARTASVPRLREEDQDVLDLVDLLFERLLEPFPGTSARRELLTSLQIPVLRVALRDTGFFTRRTHAARRLLGELAEGLGHWIEDEDADRAVLDKLKGALERLLRDYQDQIEPFEQAVEEVERQFGALQKKVEIAERRHVEAARGREKLDLAQAAAEEAVHARLADSCLPGAVQSLLQNAWVDAVALAMLRQGVDHAKTDERLDVVDRLVDAFGEPGPPDAVWMLDSVRGEIEDGLSAIGFHDDAIAAAWADLRHLAEVRTELVRQTVERKLDELMRQRPRLGGGARVGEVEAGVMVPGKVGLETLAAREAIEKLAQGSWLEILQEPPLPPLRRRLCWLSPITGRCLLLNPRGSRLEERQLDRLAEDWAQRRVRVIDAEQGYLVDRAWREILSTLHGASAHESGS
ncbi:MAG: DUF1631 family protein [Xanthomonadales bacterium]|nr:hypothetical protein [Xanthomonadales bacterium]MCC6594851.1 DUF1631 family protein [Xanthomonadales bacterium]MCE7930096.1 DUF1631 family protein [Xanthomonadales bacterium PRO6]